MTRYMIDSYMIDSYDLDQGSPNYSPRPHPAPLNNWSGPLNDPNNPSNHGLFMNKKDIF